MPSAAGCAVPNRWTPWGRRASEEAAVVLGTWSFVGRGYSDNDSAYLAVTTAARTREYPDAA